MRAATNANTNAPLPTAQSAAPVTASTVPGVPPPGSELVQKLKRRFESEPRPSNADLLEAQVEDAFRRIDVPDALLKSVVCRTSVCRAAVNWSPDRMRGFMNAVQRLTPDFGPAIGFEPVTEADANNRREAHLYLPLRDGSPMSFTD